METQNLQESSSIEEKYMSINLTYYVFLLLLNISILIIQIGILSHEYTRYRYLGGNLLYGTIFLGLLGLIYFFARTKNILITIMFSIFFIVSGFGIISSPKEMIYIGLYISLLLLNILSFLGYLMKQNENINEKWNNINYIGIKIFLGIIFIFFYILPLIGMATLGDIFRQSSSRIEIPDFFLGGFWISILIVFIILPLYIKLQEKIGNLDENNLKKIKTILWFMKLIYILFPFLSFGGCMIFSS